MGLADGTAWENEFGVNPKWQKVNKVNQEMRDEINRLEREKVIKLKEISDYYDMQINVIK